MKRTQGRALEEQSKGKGDSSTSNGGSSKQAAPPRPKPHMTKAEQKAFAKLKADLTELEDYIPWQAVTASWGNRRNAWARRVRECADVPSVAKQVQLLEQALMTHALEPVWRTDVVHEWVVDLLQETKADKVRTLSSKRAVHSAAYWRARAAAYTAAQSDHGTPTVLRGYVDSW